MISVDCKLVLISTSRPTDQPSVQMSKYIFPRMQHCIGDIPINVGFVVIRCWNSLIFPFYTIHNLVRYDKRPNFIIRFWIVTVLHSWKPQFFAFIAIFVIKFISSGCGVILIISLWFFLIKLVAVHICNRAVCVSSHNVTFFLASSFKWSFEIQFENSKMLFSFSYYYRVVSSGVLGSMLMHPK